MNNFGSIKCSCNSDRASKIGCVWFVVMNNILKVGALYLVACIQFCPDGIIIMALLISGSSIITQIFWVNAVNFEVFSKWVIPIKVRIWVFSYKGVQWVKWIWWVYWIIICGYINVCSNWGWVSIWNYIDCIDRNIYRPRVWFRVAINEIFGFLPWQKYGSIGRVSYGEDNDSFDEAINALNGNSGCEFTLGPLENPDQIHQSHL